MANIDQWPEVGRAHGEVFRTFTLATTMIEVKRPIDPERLVAVEVDAIVSHG
jgi:hypothetical protein